MVYNNKPPKKNQKASYTTQQTHDKIQKGRTFWLEIPSYMPNQAENEQQTTFMNKKVEAFALFLCCYITTNHPRKIEKVRIQNNKLMIKYKMVEPFGLKNQKALYTKQQTHDKIQKGQTFWLEMPSYMPSQAENEQQTTFMNKKVEAFALFLCCYITTNHPRKIEKVRIQNNKLMIKYKKIKPFGLKN